jgi:hypothetical protein
MDIHAERATQPLKSTLSRPSNCLRNYCGRCEEVTPRRDANILRIAAQRPCFVKHSIPLAAFASMSRP